MSGRHDTENGIPTIDRDPVIFAKMISLLQSKPGSNYIQADENTQAEFEFMCIDFKEFNFKFFQDFFNSKPVAQKDGWPTNFMPIDVSKIEIDHTLEF